jgi:hypothetical protein
MATQLSPSVYAQCIQFQLDSVLPVPVYANFNRNYATEGDTGFAVWQLRNVHQQVFTGQTQSNKSIDRPVFQLTIYCQSMETAFNLSNTVLQSLHGYSGMFGNPSTNGFFVAKVDVDWLFNTYDNETGLNQIILDCTLDVPA